MTKLKVLLSCLLIGSSAFAFNVIRTNQIGYRTDDFKAAVFLDSDASNDLSFVISDGANTFAPDSVKETEPWSPAKQSARIYFSSISTPGQYEIQTLDKQGNVLCTGAAYIGDDAYSKWSMHELPLNYLRQQRCGDNPVYGEACHQHDGYLVLSGDRDGEKVDVRGGWHDASDFLQYLPTSANTVYQLLFAYKQNPQIWGDAYDAAGKPGSNGVPDILDEARHGLEWMLRMNPEPGLYFNQIADDRDHRYSGLPAGDNVDYGWGAGTGRPVYPCSGKPYGLLENKNRSMGTASSVAKFASAFALGAELFAESDSEFADALAHAATAAYDNALANPGACQTAPCISPYFYEEDNYVDDVQLAATSLYSLTKEAEYLRDAVNYGRMEPVTPWMGADSARHYQWYPFVNLGHYQVAQGGDAKASKEFKRNMRTGLQRVAERGEGNAFKNGLPFIWCSNNLAVAYVTQAMLYREATGSNEYAEYEAAIRDWLFGCNPWGQVMIMLPEGMAHISSPLDPHSTIIGKEVGGKPGRHWLSGGLVDGPVYNAIFSSLRGVYLRNEDKFAEFQNDYVVYHDDYSDYSTNEPTMDGTASLAYMLSVLCSKR